MTIQATGGKLHWNYFLALERDLDVISRYVEFSERNFATYSIELAHLLFAAASEVDVVAKLLCEKASPDRPRENILQYKAALLPALPDIPTTHVVVERYGLLLTPWDNWAGNEAPEWWRSYNKVKHERDTHFHEATLKNTLNALGALLILAHYYYSFALAGPVGGRRLDHLETTRALEPQPSLMRLRGDFYYEAVYT